MFRNRHAARPASAASATMIMVGIAMLTTHTTMGFQPSTSLPIIRASTTTRLSATAAAVSESPRVKRVAIVGAGISGLALAHALTSSSLNGNNEHESIEVTLFDARPNFDESAGSGLQLTGGMAALRAIDVDLQRKVSEAALPFEGVTSRCKPWFGGESVKGGGLGKSDPMMGTQLLEMDIPDMIRQNNAATAEKAAESGSGEKKVGLVTEDGDVLAYTILRGTLQRVLQEELIDRSGIEVKFGKTLTGIEYTESGDEGIVCRFKDGTESGPFDIVAGCDGIKSAVKYYVDNGKSSSSSAGGNDDAAIYSGIRITFAIKDGEDGDENGNGNNGGARFSQAFGEGAYALTSRYGTGKGMPPAEGAFLIYGDEDYIGPFKKKKEESPVAATTTIVADADDSDENADWTQDNRVQREHVTEGLEVLNRAGIPSADAVRIVSSADRFFDLGVYFHNPFSWNGWSREVRGTKTEEDGGRLARTGRYCVLVGDAAHAMPPFLGQGANQAIQDAYVLAEKIRRHNANVDAIEENPDLKALLDEYESSRWLPTASITAKAAFLGYLEVSSGAFAKFRDVFFFTMGKIGVAKKVFLDSANPKI